MANHTSAARIQMPVMSGGFSLIELLVAITISSFLVFGATQVYVDSRNTYVIHETTARMQETARYALSVMEPDIRMANNWGLMKAGTIAGSAAQTAAAATTLAGASATVCGTNFSVDLQTYLEGTNDSYGLGCAAFGAGAMVTADTLTVRHASLQPTSVAAATSGPLRICSTRTNATLVNNASACTSGVAGAMQVFDLVVHGYYVDRDSAQAAGMPSLRRKSLNATPTFPSPDDEIVAGVEDMQVQFGIDPSVSGVATGGVTQYVDALTPASVPVGSQIVSVRIWLLVRADTREPGFVDNRTYQYGNRALANGTTATLTAASAASKAYRPADNFRRLLVSRTVSIRNALGT